MATVSYTFVSRCSGGCHAVLDVSFNGGAAKRVTYEVDELRAPIGNLTADDREDAALKSLRIHLAGKTRPQIVSEFQAGPVVITI